MYAENDASLVVQIDYAAGDESIGVVAVSFDLNVAPESPRSDDDSDDNMVVGNCSESLCTL